MAIRSLPLLCVLVVACGQSSLETSRQHLEAGDRFVAQQKLPEAIVEYRNAAAADRKSGEARMKLAEAYAKTGDTRRALAEYVRAADLRLDDVDAQLKAARYLLLAGQYEDARARAQKALDRNPRNAEALVIRGSALAGMKDLEGALEQIEDAIRAAPDSGLAYSNLALLKYASGHREEARAAFVRAVDVEPNSVPALLALASFHLANGESAEADEVLKRALAVDDENRLTHRMLATLYLNTGRVLDAEPHVKAVARLDPTARGQFVLADYYQLTLRPNEAKAILEKLTDDRKTFAAAETALAKMYYRDGDRTAAHKRLDEILAKEPNNANVWLVKSDWQLREGKPADAAGSAAKAVRAAPGAAMAHYLLGVSQAELHQTDAAIASFQEVLRLNPNVSVARVQLSRLELRRGNSKVAEEYAGDILKAQPEAFAGRVSMARALVAQRDVPKSEAAIKSLLADYPNASVVHTLDGSLQLQKRNLQAARTAFDRALKLDPASIDAFSGLVSTDVLSNRISDARARVDARLRGKLPTLDDLLIASRVYVRANDPVAAERTLRQAINMAPADGVAVMLLANLYAAQGKLDQAQVEFDQMVQRNPNDYGNRLMSALIAHTRGRTGDAQKRYEEVLERNPNVGLAANNLAWILSDKGDLDGALRLAQKAVERGPDNADYNDTLGWIYLRKQLPSLAITPLERAVAQDLDNAKFRYHLGRALVESGTPAKARSHLEKAVAAGLSDSDGAAARKLLTDLN